MTRVSDLIKGFAYKTGAGYHHPKDGRLITLEELRSFNQERRRQVTTKEAYQSLKEIDPAYAKKVGWNRFQRWTKGHGGDRDKLVTSFFRRSKRTKTLRAPPQVLEAWAADADKSSWGDST